MIHVHRIGKEVGGIVLLVSIVLVHGDIVYEVIGMIQDCCFPVIAGIHS